MILLFGGTTEGRACVKTLDEAGSTFYYSTRGSEQQIESKHGIRLTGAMDREAMISFCREKRIGMVIDAAHPFAARLHQTVAEVATLLKIPHLRYERCFPALHPNDILCASYDEAIEKLEQAAIHCLLALTGVQTIGNLKRYWEKHDCFFRILEREQSYQLAESQGFPKERLIGYDPDQPITELIRQVGADAVLTKESGESGGFVEKEQACLESGIPLFVVRRPLLPPSFRIVTGKYGLRRAVEQILPAFYPLHSGFTTGSCATVAAKAALYALLGRDVPREMPFTLPDGEEMSMPIERAWAEVDCGKAIVRKEAGDDPDITDGHLVAATVRYATGPGIRFLRGEGVGRVTLPGLGIPVGEAAINRVPREMMSKELAAIYPGGLTVEIAVPDGEQLARNTFNPRLGIEGGISIIGTSGIVTPFSAEAFVDAIKREMEVAVALKVSRIVLNSGAKSEKYIKQLYPDLPQQAFIHFGNFIGDSLQVAEVLGIKQVTLGIMLGKAVKLAAGNLDTHSKKVTLDRDFLFAVAKEANCSTEAETVIQELVLARSLWERLSAADQKKFFTLLVEKAYTTCRRAYPQGELTLLLIHENGTIPYALTRGSSD